MKKEVSLNNINFASYRLHFCSSRFMHMHSLTTTNWNKNKNKNIFISINNDIANLYIEENYTNVNIAIMVISIRVMIIKYNIQN